MSDLQIVLLIVSCVLFLGYIICLSFRLFYVIKSNINYLDKKGSGKDYAFQLKFLKKLCIKYYGIGFIFSTPKVRAVLLENMNDFITSLTEAINK